MGEIEVFDDFARAERDWRRLEATCAASPYQTFAFCSAWMATIGATEGATPLIAIARARGGEPIALLPLQRRRFGPLNVASFQGGRMANYQFGLFREPDSWARADVVPLLQRIAGRARVDLFVFAQQPLAWRGRVNPLRELGGAPSPSFAYATRLDDDYSAWLAAHYSADARKKRRAKTRKLGALGPLTAARAATPAARRAAFEAFLAQKRARMAALALPDEFEDPAMRAFVALLGGVESDEPEAGFDWFVASAGERIVSVFAGLERAGRLSGLLFSHDMAPEVAIGSPGEWLTHALVEDGIARGLEAIDFGVGEARYKAEICEIAEPQFDTAFATTAIGAAGALAFRWGRALKRHIKHSPRLFDAARAVQRLIVRPRAR